MTRGRRQAPPAVPDRYRPVSLDSVANLLGRRAPPDGVLGAAPEAEDLETYLARRAAIATIGEHADKHEWARRQMDRLMAPHERDVLRASQASGVNGRHAQLHPATTLGRVHTHDDSRRGGKGNGKRNPDGQPDGTEPPAWRTCRMLDAANPHHTDGQPLGGVAKTTAETDIAFDPDTMITGVKISGYEVEMSRAQAQAMIEAGDPRRWARQPNDFFARSEPGEWKHGSWTAKDWAPSARGGDLYEIVRWAWNDETCPTELHNILRITDFVQNENELSYRFSLRQSLKSRIAVFWEVGGLEVDSGGTTVKVISSVGDRVRVTIEAEKRLRYARPSGLPPEIGDLYNTMAPAVLTMFMRAIVFHGADRFVAEQAQKRATASSPSSLNRTERHGSHGSRL